MFKRIKARSLATPFISNPEAVKQNVETKSKKKKKKNLKGN